MSLAMSAHEIAIVTVIPVLGFVVLRDYPPRRAIAVLAPPVLVALVLFVVTPSADGAVRKLTSTLQVANFAPRPDALGPFQRTQSETMALYSVRDVFLFLLPLVIVLGAAFFLLYWTGSRGRPRTFSSIYLLLGVGAIASPIVLSFAGWDEFRWAFLLMTNFFIVLWLWLGDTGRELNPVQWVTLAVVVLVTCTRSCSTSTATSRARSDRARSATCHAEIEDGTLFEIPRR